jgi:hypothetical protein
MCVPIPISRNLSIPLDLAPSRFQGLPGIAGPVPPPLLIENATSLFVDYFRCFYIFFKNYFTTYFILFISINSTIYATLNAQ